MDFSKYSCIFIFLILVCIGGCKSSKVAKADAKKWGKSSRKKPSETTTTEQPPEEDYDHANVDDLIQVSSSIRKDLENYFEAFSRIDISDETARQTHLEMGFKFFESADTPVLTIVNELNGKAVYDKPTSIEQYLDYLKHTKQNPHTIYNFELNEQGKISKLELTLK